MAREEGHGEGDKLPSQPQDATYLKPCRVGQGGGGLSYSAPKPQILALNQWPPEGPRASPSICQRLGLLLGKRRVTVFASQRRSCRMCVEKALARPGSPAFLQRCWEDLRLSLGIEECLLPLSLEVLPNVQPESLLLWVPYCPHGSESKKRSSCAVCQVPQCPWPEHAVSLGSGGGRKQQTPSSLSLLRCPTTNM